MFDTSKPAFFLFRRVVDASEPAFTSFAALLGAGKLFLRRVVGRGRTGFFLLRPRRLTQANRFFNLGARRRLTQANSPVAKVLLLNVGAKPRPKSAAEFAKRNVSIFLLLTLANAKKPRFCALLRFSEF